MDSNSSNHSPAQPLTSTLNDLSLTSSLTNLNKNIELDQKKDFIINTLEDIKEDEFSPQSNNLQDQDKKDSTMTVSKVYDPTEVLLFKGVPYDATETDIINLTRFYGIVEDAYLVRHKGYAYVQFKELQSAMNCYADFSTNKPTLKKSTLHVFYTGKSKIVKPNTLVVPPSKFLLLIFQKYFIPISTEIIQQILMPYGTCVKIIIFQAKFLQAFVEMEDIGQAIMAKENLQNAAIPSITMNILYIEQKDFFIHHQDHIPNPPILSVPPMNQPMYFSMPEIHTQYRIQPISPYSGMNEPAHILSGLQNIPNFKQGSWTNPYKPISSPLAGFFSGQNSPDIHSNPSSFVRDCQRSLTSVDFTGAYQKFAQSMKLNPNSYETDRKPQKDGNIVLVKNLPPKITPIMLFRLFGMYGDVQKVKIFFKNPENALIEYTDHSQALLAKMHLNNCLVLGNNIFVTISKQGIYINTSNLKKGEENDLVADYTDSKDHRYKIAGSQNYRNIAAPSKVLHLSNLSPDKDVDFYKELFKNYGRIIKVHFLKVEGKMLLMEMASINDAVSILMHFHNYNIDGKFLKVSFSKYQKIRD